MLNKLALRNARRSFREYFLYFFTMILITALMFSFHSMIYSKAILTLAADGGMFGVMIALASVFIVFIVLWLIHYMVNFMAKRRSREFALYMLLGFHKKQISRLFLKENMVLGALAFLAGLIPGIFLQQVLTAAVYGVLEASYKIRPEFNLKTLFLTAAVYGGAYVLALLRNNRRLKKRNIREILEQERENERQGAGNRTWPKWLFLAALGCLIFFSVQMYRGGIHYNTVLLWILGLIVSAYVLFFGLSAFLVSYIRKGPESLWRRGNLFVFRQLAGKIRTMGFTMSTLMILFTAALVGCCCAFMLSRFQETQGEEKWPFDVACYNPDPEYNFDRERERIKAEEIFKQELAYQIYENHTKSWSAYLDEHIAPDNYFAWDTYIRESDYNQLRSMLGYEPVSLGTGEYLVQIKARLKSVAELLGKKNLVIGNTEYTCKGIYTEAFEQSGHNGADFLLVIPDEAADFMKPYYSLYMAVTKHDLTQEEGEKLRTALLKINDVSTGEKMYDDWEAWEEKDSRGLGSDTMVVSNSFVFVKSIDTYEMRFMLSTFMFPLFYIGLVFLCVAMTVLGVQQLCDTEKYRRNFSILRKLGMRKEETDGLLLRQLVFYYLCPFGAALVFGGILSGYVSMNFSLYSGVTDPVWSYFGISLLLFLLVYGIYFAMTYLELKRSL